MIIKGMHSKVHKARLLAVHSQMDRPEGTPDDPPTIHAYFGLLQHIFHRNKQTIRNLKDSPLRTRVAPHKIQKKISVQLNGIQASSILLHQNAKGCCHKADDDFHFMPIGAAYKKLKESYEKVSSERINTTSCTTWNYRSVNKQPNLFTNRKYSLRQERKQPNRAKTQYSPSLADSLRNSYRSHQAMEPPIPTPW